MEPTIIGTLRNYVIAQGNPRHAVELLTDNYTGYAQMASLACGWLKLVDEMGDEEEEDERNVSHGHRTKTATTTSSRSPAPAPVPTTTSPPSAPLSEMDEAYFLRQLCLQKFDPGVFSGVFSAGGGGIPPWLNPLIADRQGRGLIYELSAKYQSSLLLNFAMQKILMRPGGDVEAAGVGASLSSFFGVYHRLLGVRLRQVAAAQDEATLQRLTKEICESAAQSQHAYVHAQQMLMELALPLTSSAQGGQDSTAKGEGEDDGGGVETKIEGTPWSARFMRISQELEASVPGPIPWKMHRWFDPDAALDLSTGTGTDTGTGNDGDGGREAASTAAWLVSDILASTSSGSIAATSDVIKLYRLYSDFNAVGGEHGPSATLSSSPPVRVLRHPRLIEVLLHAVFAPGKQLQWESQSAFIGVVALAVAAVEADPTQQQGVVDGDRGEATMKDNNKTGILPPQEQKEVNIARKSLEIVANLSHKALRDELLTEEEQQQGEEALKEPCSAAGILGMLRSRLTSPEHWAAAYHIHKEPPFLPLLLAIVRQQPAFHADILSLISGAMGAMGSSPAGPDVSRALLRVAVALVAAGRVEPVLAWAATWSRNADAALVRCLFFGLLEIAAPPYSAEFARALVGLGAVGGALRQKIGSREWRLRVEVLTEFYAAIMEASLPSGTLKREEVSFLRELNLCLHKST